MISRGATRAAYDTVAADYAALLPDASFEAPDDVALIDRFLDLLPSGARVVDAGCGAGRMLRLMHDRRPDLRTAGIDLSPRMIEQARAGCPFADLAVGDLGELPLPERSAAGLLAWYSVIHATPDELAVIAAEFARVSMPGGLVLLGFQSGSGTRRIERAYGHDVSLDAVLHEPRDVAATFAALGFEVLEQFERPARDGERHAQGFVLARREVSPRDPTAAAGG
ncbi:class I SAM-dependent methyltransferase [Microbacterium sp. BDGP8]|uniref:class I SAM-dependent DNA methyltransferase n=1 Tax=Microbacterium sp. BDGP8 TaxID=3035531 RepID=UPI00249E57B9|nr:class I SAM-dependent methyltransferase [Microbacterium sp. BDGP8]WHE36581.1 class I SAM-dependent methyltransferase [Microbacterium sp. BDGP8]